DGTFIEPEIYNPSNNSWRQTAHLAADQVFFSLTPLKAGRALGVNRNGDAWIYSSSTNAWKSTGNAIFGAGRSNATALLNDGKVLFLSSDSKSAQIYDPNTGVWKSVAAPTSLSEGPDAVLLNDGTVLVMGGNPKKWPALASAAAEIFDPATQTWTLVQNM